VWDSSFSGGLPDVLLFSLLNKLQKIYAARPQQGFIQQREQQCTEATVKSE